MQLYIHNFNSTYVTVGDKVKIGNEVVIIKEIIKIIFETKTMHFIGISLNKLF